MPYESGQSRRQRQRTVVHVLLFVCKRCTAVSTVGRHCNSSRQQGASRPTIAWALPCRPATDKQSGHYAAIHLLHHQISVDSTGHGGRAAWEPRRRHRIAGRRAAHHSGPCLQVGRAQRLHHPSGQRDMATWLVETSADSTVVPAIRSGAHSSPVVVGQFRHAPCSKRIQATLSLLMLPQEVANGIHNALACGCLHLLTRMF